MWECGSGHWFHPLQNSYSAPEAEQRVSLRWGGRLVVMNSSPFTSLSLLTCSCIVFSREEHKKHSSGSAFLSVKKQFEELTLSEFLKLDKERTKNKIVCITGNKNQEQILFSIFSTELLVPHKHCIDAFPQHFLNPSDMCVRYKRTEKHMT